MAEYEFRNAASAKRVSVPEPAPFVFNLAEYRYLERMLRPDYPIGVVKLEFKRVSFIGQVEEGSPIWKWDEYHWVEECTCGNEQDDCPCTGNLKRHESVLCLLCGPHYRTQATIFCGSHTLCKACHDILKKKLKKGRRK
jgi:hypothetical protein